MAARCSAWDAVPRSEFMLVQVLDESKGVYSMVGAASVIAGVACVFWSEGDHWRFEARREQLAAAEREKEEARWRRQEEAAVARARRKRAAEGETWRIAARWAETGDAGAAALAARAAPLVDPIRRPGQWRVRDAAGQTATVDAIVTPRPVTTPLAPILSGFYTFF